MKRAAIILMFVLMFGWAIYEFVSNTNQSAEESDEVKQETMSQDDGDSNSSTTEENNGDEQEDIEVVDEEEGLDVGNVAPDVLLTTLEGEEVYLSDYRGKRVMLNFWGTWCPPCRAEMPDMEKFHQDTEIEIIAVNLIETESNVDQVHDFIGDYGLTFTVLLDEGNEAATTYQIQPIPTSYLINSDGTIHNKAFGALNYELMVQEFEKMN